MSQPRQTPTGGNDPAVRVPAAVRRAAAAADKAHNQAYAPETPAPAAPTAANPASSPLSLKLAPEDPPPTAAPAPAPAAPEVTEESWKARYEAMKGRWDASNAQLRDQNQKIVNLENVVASIATAPKAEPAPKELRGSSLLTAEERANYGDEFIDVAQRAAREALEPELEKLRSENAELKNKLQGVGNTVDQDAKQRMFDELDAKCPTWRKVNEQPEFHQWLALQDTYSGATRMNLLRAAFEQNITPRVLAFFNGFLAEEAALTRTTVEPPPAPAAPAAEKVALETLAAPGRAKSAAPASPAEKPFITGAQIATFYNDVRRGVYAGRDAEKADIEKMIFAAQAEGRIRN